MTGTGKGASGKEIKRPTLFGPRGREDRNISPSGLKAVPLRSGMRKAEEGAGWYEEAVFTIRFRRTQSAACAG